jgi:HD-like signal output (HDOD) protein
MSRVIQLDPAMAAKLIQVANSAMYSGHSKVVDCRTAVARLGMETTRNMVMGLALGDSFRIGSAVVRDIARQTWNKSSEVAAISYVLAKVTMGMVPDKAMLAGLVHNIGAIPILKYATEYTDLKANRSLISELIQRLSSKLGSLVLRQWGFEDDMAEVPRQIGNKDYAPDQELNYVDIVIVADLHSQFGKEQGNMPDLNAVASFRKMPLFRIGPDASIELLYEAKGEINQLTQMLMSAA